MIDRTFKMAAGAALLVAGCAGPALAQTAVPAISSTVPTSDLTVKGASGGLRGGRLVIPDSSRRQRGRMHTNYRIFVPNGPKQTTSGSDTPDAPGTRVAPGGLTPNVQPGGTTQSPPNPPYAGYYYETPASLACIYGLVTAASGCDPNQFKTNNSGGNSPVIGIYAAYDDPTVLSDLQAFSTQFGLPAPNLTVLFSSGSRPSSDASFAGETALDVEMAHAMSPNSRIILVESPTNNFGDFFSGIDFLINQVQTAGGGIVSISYGGDEADNFNFDANADNHFANKSNVVVFASSGDAPGAIYPSTSPNVVAVGGTGTAREQLAAGRIGQFNAEVAWNETGGGFSQYFARPSYQVGIAARTYNVNARTTPDVSAVADPQTGVWVYCSSGCGNTTSNGWLTIGGTSVASPVVAAMTGNRGPLKTTSMAQLAYIYSRIGTSDYFDVTRGICGPNAGFQVTAGTSGNAANGYDLCTGIGSPRYTPLAATAATKRSSRR